MNNTAHSPITVTAFKWVPPFAQGLVRDLRVRWALEEAGLPYQIELIGFEVCNTPEYRAWQPFGQVPAFEQDGLKIFESGAIVLHIAEQSPKLMPEDPVARARVRTWMFAAINSMENATQNLAIIDFQSGSDAEWARLRRPAMVEFTRRRLRDLSTALGEREYLAGGFSAADLLMTTVLRISRGTGLVEEHANLKAYVERCEARPTFQKALTEQMAVFAQNSPPAKN